MTLVVATKEVIGLSDDASCMIIPGTTRGQADGFDLEILAKLKDVKSKVNVVGLHKICILR